MHNFRHGCAAFVACSYVLSVLCPAFAQAPSASRRIAALDLIPVGVSDPEARGTTEVLRRAVGRNPRYRLAPAPLRLRPMLLALGCAKLDLACLARIGKQLDVDQILFGELSRARGVDRLTLQLFDVVAQKVSRTEQRDITEAPGSEAYVSALDDTTYLALGDTLQLQLESNVEGAIVLVNGQPVGTTPWSGGEGLRPGNNEIVVRQRDHEDFRSTVVVRPGKAVTLRAELKKKGGAPVLVEPVVSQPPDVASAGTATPDGGAPVAKKDDVGSEPIYKKWWFWTIIGAVVVGGTVGAVAATRGGGNERPPAVGVEF